MTKNSSMSSETAIISLTENSIKVAEKIEKIFDNSCVFVMKKHEKSAKNLKNVSYYESLSNLLSTIFSKYDCLIFIMATGIVVRHISKYVMDKMSDPAVIVCDEKLQFAISLLSGHIGEANKICEYMAEKLAVTPVITTSTDVNKKSALDTLALRLNAVDEQDRALYKKINYKLANNEKVYLISDIELDDSYDLRGFSVVNYNVGDDKLGVIDIDGLKTDEYIIHLTYKDVTGLENLDNYSKIYLKNIVLGIGCRKNTSPSLLLENVLNFLKIYNISPKSVSTIGSIALKKDEKAIIKLANHLKANFVVFEAEEIKSSPYYESLPKNEFVENITGVSSVSLSTAMIMSDDDIIGETFKNDGMTISIGRCRNNILL